MKKNKLKFISLAAGLSLALAFTSCIPNNAKEDEPDIDSSGVENSSSSAEERAGISSSAASSVLDKTNNCYWYADGNGKYDYKCGFEPPCYPNPDCPDCPWSDVCYTYPTECAQNDISGQYKCRDVSNPGQFNLVGKDHCCYPSYCYSEGNEPVICDEACHPSISVELKEVRSLLPLYACYVEKRSSSSSVEIKPSSSSLEKNSSSSVVRISSSSDKANNCYWYEDGNGGYDYKCGFESPCYADPNCPLCKICYPYPTECGLVDAPCLRDPKYGESADCQRVYECREVVDPAKFKLVEKGACCSPPNCYSEGNEPAKCPAVCTLPITVGLNGIESALPLYTCYVEKRSSSSSARSSSSEVNSLFEEYGLILQSAVLYNDLMPCGGVGCEGERASICAIHIISASPLPAMKVSANIITSTLSIKNMPFDNVNIWNGDNKYNGDYRPARGFRADSGDKYTMEITVEIHGKRQTTVVHDIVGVVH